eukprot:scaffold269435_cov19-Tisochrysis_lutea.AAC.3
MARPQQLPYTRKDVLRAFAMFAKNGEPEGYINPEKLEEALQQGQETGPGKWCKVHCLSFTVAPLLTQDVLLSMLLSSLINKVWHRVLLVPPNSLLILALDLFSVLLAERIHGTWALGALYSCKQSPTPTQHAFLFMVRTDLDCLRL